MYAAPQLRPHLAHSPRLIGPRAANVHKPSNVTFYRVDFCHSGFPSLAGFRTAGRSWAGYSFVTACSLNLPHPWRFRVTYAAWLLIAQSTHFSHVHVYLCKFRCRVHGSKGFPAIHPVFLTMPAVVAFRAQNFAVFRIKPAFMKLCERFDMVNM